MLCMYYSYGYLLCFIDNIFIGSTYWQSVVESLQHYFMAPIISVATSELS